MNTKMKNKATTLDAYQLLHEGSLALSTVESNGICIDTEYLQKAIKQTARKIKEQTEDIKNDEIFKTWKKRFGTKTNMDSSDQLGKVLFENMGYTCPVYTQTGKPKTDIAVLSELNIPFVKSLLSIKQLKKAKGTYLSGIEKETIDGLLHAFFDLGLAVTYRSSSSKPNFQNWPIRNYEMGKLIRQCFIPRSSKRHIVELDYGGIEVHGAAWYHKDPMMLDYLHDKTKDMHRDMAMQCYMLSKKEMTPKNEDDAKRIKDIRYCGKNRFVFPEFYGDWWLSCAPALWNSISQMKLKTREGLSLRKHLKSKGINRLGIVNIDATQESNTFLYHIKQVERDFWNSRFKVYRQWKEDWYNAYRKNGKFMMLTGFEISGLMKRNEVINYPVQGVAFHCLLWSLTRIQKLLNKYKMKSLIVGQIHDSIVGDILKSELQNYLEIANKVMTVDIKKHWSWITTPLEIEAEVSPVGKSWFEKTKVKI